MEKFGRVFLGKTAEFLKKNEFFVSEFFQNAQKKSLS